MLKKVKGSLCFRLNPTFAIEKMRNINLKLLISIVAAALIGLIAVQLYWVHNAFDLRKEEFQQKVNEALLSVSDKLEKKEAIEKLKSHQQGKFLFFDSDSSITNSGVFPDSGFSQFAFKEIIKKGKNVDIKIVEEIDGLRTEKIITKESDTINETIEKEYFNENITFKIDSDVKHKSHEKNVLDSIVASRMVNKSAFVGDIVKSLIKVNFNEKIQDRISPKEVDSLLNIELSFRGISTGFKFGIYDYTNQLVLSDSVDENYSSVQLFPNDIIQKPNFLRVHFPKQHGYILKSIWAVLLLSIIVVLILLIAFSVSVSTIIQQKKLSEIKNDFINNMTHELKTPISTISIACEALNDPLMSSNQTIVSKYLGMINDENNRLGTLVENVLQRAILDKGDFKLKLKQFDFSELIKEAVGKSVLRVEEKKGKIEFITKSKAIIEADELHITNVVYNLIDNAIKYTPEKPVIILKLEPLKSGFLLTVSDNGVGVSKENQKKIFDKLFRVPTGNIHNVKGFGLGLSYVKTVVEKHCGEIAIKSDIGAGSVFSIYLPSKPKI